MENYYGVTQNALEWIKSYLTDRAMVVCINNVYSDIKYLSYSVPQGSCSGPNYYNFYASTITSIIPKNQDIYAFADDHTLLQSFNSKEKDAETTALLDVEKTLLDISNWMDQNCLKMNSKKTEIIYYGGRRMLQNSMNNSIKVKSDVVRL